MDEVEESLQDSIAALEEIAAGVKPPEAWSQLGDVTIERFLPPRIPVDRVVGVLEQVRARLIGQPVGHAPSVARGV